MLITNALSVIIPCGISLDSHIFRNRGFCDLALFHDHYALSNTTQPPYIQLSTAIPAFTDNKTKVRRDYIIFLKDPYIGKNQGEGSVSQDLALCEVTTKSSLPARVVSLTNSKVMEFI